MPLDAVFLMRVGMTDWLLSQWWWLLPLTILVAPYLLGPLLIRASLKFGANFRVERFDAVESPPPDRAGEFFEETAEDLQLRGFEVVDHLYVRDVMEGMLIVFSVMENRATDDAAMAAVFLGTINGTSVRQRYVEFSSELIDGTEIDTNNSKEEATPVPLPWKRTVQLDTERDAVALYRLHQRAVEEWATTSKRPLKSVDDWAEEIRTGMLREFDGFVDAGYYFLDADGEYYRLTWKGAYLMTWQQLWPVVTLRRMGRRRRAEALLSGERSFAA